MMRTTRRGFTLIELLTVMAISVILLGLITVPLFQSFNVTRTAQAFADAQERARILSEKISREIGNAALVRNGSNVVPTIVNNAYTRVAANSLVIRVPAAGNNGLWPSPDGATVETVIPYTKLDLVRPAEGDPTLRGPGGGYINPGTGKEDPTLQTPKGQVNLPVAPGNVLVRYWIGKRDPFAPYTNPYDGLLTARGGGRDNLFVLYRAEIVPFVWRNNKNSPGDNSTRSWRPDLRYFTTDDTDTFIVDADDPSVVVGLDDPRFFTPNVDASGAAIVNGDRADTIRNWRNKAIIQTEISRYDMILPVYDRATRRVQALGTQNLDAITPRLLPLVQFRPSRVSAEMAEGQVAARQGEESDSASSAAPDVFVTQFGLWGNAIIRAYPQGWDIRDSARNEYLVARGKLARGNQIEYSLFAYDPDLAMQDIGSDTDVELFSLSAYDRVASARGLYPFSQAFLNSGWNANARLRELFTPFSFNPTRGKIVASFGLDEVGNPSINPNPLRPNWPSVYTGVARAPQFDPAPGGSFWQYRNDINGLFNKVWADYPSLQPNQVHRFIDLRVTPNADGTPNPLYPDYMPGEATGFTYDTGDGGKRSKVSIVPGSEVVEGPDQLNPNNPNLIRYTRVTRGNPGPNQYRLNYTDLQEPVDQATGRVDYSVEFDALPNAELAGFNPRVYNPQNLVSAILQPRYKVGYLQLNSDPNIALREGPIFVYYRFQFTGTRPTGSYAALAGGIRATRTDAFSVDYDTRQLMDVLITIRNYPQATNVPNPQTVTLKSTATVRNATR